VRFARLGDFKRRAVERAGDWVVKIDRFAVTDVPSLGSAEFAPPSPFVVIAGANGVGKTTLLRALWASAAPEEIEELPGTSFKLTGGAAALDFTVDGIAGQSNVTFQSGKIDGGTSMPTIVRHLDAAHESQALQKQFCAFESLEELTNGEANRQVSEADLLEINYILGRDYRSITINEIDNEGEIVPFFEVVYGDSHYDSRSMGAGELSALYTWWVLNQTDLNSVLLIEEPEAFLSPISQQRIAHHLLVETVEKKLVTIITSHSAAVIQSVDDIHRVFVLRDGAGIQFSAGRVSPALLRTIGIEFSVDRICLVEDEAAAQFLKLLLERHRPDLARRTEIVPKNGEGNITRVLELVASPFKSTKIFGVYDGDQRGKVKNEVLALAGFLPGKDSVEKVFKTIITGDVVGAEAAIGCNNLSAILFSIEGQDIHDWYHGLCDQVGLTKSQLLPALFALWERQEGNDAAAQVTVTEVAALIDGN